MNQQLSLIMFFFTCYCHPALAQTDGELDNTFDSDGIVVTDFFTKNDRVNSVAIQDDGKIIVGGMALLQDISEFALARYNEDGSLDLSFGNAGKVATIFNNVKDEATAIAIESETGKIVAAGYSMSHGDANKGDIAIARYNPDGSLDNSFSGDGKLITVLGTIPSAAYALGLQSDGKIVVAGIVFNNGQYENFVVIRYNNDGTFDNTFNSVGVLYIELSQMDDRANALVIQEDGKILISGYSYNNTNPSNQFAMVRINQDGSIDNSFGINGVMTTHFGSVEDYSYSIALQDDNKIILAGYSFNGSHSDFALARYNENGSLDNTFSGDGLLTTNFNGTSFESISSVIIQPDGKILAGGASTDESLVGFDFALARYNSDGSLDNTFSSDGKLITQISTNINDQINSLALQQNGNIIAAGYSYGPSGMENFTITRYLSQLSVGTINFSNENLRANIYPNPIIEESILEYSLTTNEKLSLFLVDVGGNIVKTFFSEQLRNKGLNKEYFNVSNIQPGEYFLQLSNQKNKVSVTIFIQ
ncbi:MAG: T9SS type A sorting domain-containing protein [Bacteroidia bacterium]